MDWGAQRGGKMISMPPRNRVVRNQVILQKYMAKCSLGCYNDWVTCFLSVVVRRGFHLLSFGDNIQPESQSDSPDPGIYCGRCLTSLDS
jgi:hypothetical protein